MCIGAATVLTLLRRWPRNLRSIRHFPTAAPTMASRLAVIHQRGGRGIPRVFQLLIRICKSSDGP